MIEVTVKTLDSQNHSYSVPDDITVKAFKEKIAPSVGIPADKQRLIFCGRVLQDEKKLSEFDVHGKVIHLVQRPPPQAAGQSSSSSSTSSSNSRPTGQGNPREGGNFLLGAFTIPQDVIGAAQVEQIVQDVVNGMGEIGRNATVMSRTSDDGSSVDVHINLGYVPLQSAAQMRIQQCHTFLRGANRILVNLESGAQNGSSNSSPMQTDTENDENTRGASAEPDRMEESSNNAAPSEAHAEGSAASTSDANVKVEGESSKPKTEEKEERPKYAAERTPKPEENRSTDSGSGSSSQSSASSNGNSTPSGPNRRENNAPRAAALGNLMEELLRLQTRLQPHLQNFTQLLNTDPELNGNHTESQRFFNRVTNIMHYLSHVYHSISDLYINFNSIPPRMVRASLLPSIGPIPVMGQIQVGLAESAPPQNAGNQTNSDATSSPNSNGTSGTQAEVPLSGGTRVNSGGLLGMPIGMGPASFNGQNPMVFMEVTPTAFTINGVSGEVISGNGAAEATSGSTPTSGVEEPNSQNNHTGANTTPTTSGSTGTRTSAISTGPSSLRTLASIPIPGLANPFSFDPCLACNSRWAANRNRSHNRPRTNQQGSTAGNNGSTQNQPGGPQTRGPGAGQQDNNLQQIISQLMNAFRTYTPGAATTNLPPGLNAAANASIPIPTPASASAFLRAFADDRVFRYPNSGPPVPPIPWLVDQMMQQRAPRGQTPDASNPSNTNSNNQSSTTANSGSNSQPTGVEPDSITNLLHSAMNQVAGAISGRSQMTVGEFVSQLDGYSYVEGESIISDLFTCVASVMTFSDLVGVFFGQVEPLNHLRPHLREFVLRKILKVSGDGPVNNTQIEQGVEVIVGQWKEHIHDACAEVNVKPGIDYEASVLKFLRTRLNDILALVLRNTTESNFGHRLYNSIRIAISEFIVLSLECFADREVSFKKLVQFGINRMSSDVSPRVPDWLLDRVAREVNSVMDNVSLSPSSIQLYIVRSGASGSSDQTEERAKPKNQDESMDVGEERKDTSGRESAQPVFARVKPPRHSPLNASGASNGVSHNVLPSVVPNDTVLPEPWHSTVPQEWVPLISCDVQRQRRQAPQPPFSDAYMNGMPSKRRRIMAESQEVLRPVQSLLPEALQRAIQSSGVQPVANMDCLIQEVTQDTNLHAAYREQVKSEVRSRISNDRDYRPDRFPNSDRYFR